MAELDELQAFPARLDPIYETVRKVREQLDPPTTLIGFAGAPWTVATYMIAGQGSREQAEARRLAYLDPGAFAAIVERIEAVTLDYLSGQIEAGAEVLQLFDSWAGSLSPSQFEQWVIAPTARLVSELKRRHPGVPIIGFPERRRRQAFGLRERNGGRCRGPRRDRRSHVGCGGGPRKHRPSRAISIRSH